MGECTIHLLIEDKLSSKADHANESNDGELFNLTSSSITISADSTLVELTSLLPLRDETLCSLASISIIDASYHPAKCITDIVRDHPDRSG